MRFADRVAHASSATPHAKGERRRPLPAPEGDGPRKPTSPRAIRRTWKTGLLLQ